MAAPSCGETARGGKRRPERARQYFFGDGPARRHETRDQAEHGLHTRSQRSSPSDAWQDSVWYLSSPSTHTPPTLTILLSFFPISARLFFNRAS